MFVLEHISELIACATGLADYSVYISVGMPVNPITDPAILHIIA